MDIKTMNAILILIMVAFIFIRNWLLENANNILNGKETISIFEAYTQNIFNLKMFIIHPIFKKTENNRTNLFVFYSNILVLVIYSLILTIIANIIYF